MSDALGSIDFMVELFTQVGPSESEMMQAIIQAQGANLAEDFLEVARGSRARRMEKDRKIADRIAHIWARGWSVFDAVINAMEQSCVLMFERAEIADAHSDLREALLLLQSMTVLTLREIRELLTAGYISGSVSRWRALHETAVTATVVANGGADIARRYLDHGTVLQFARLEAFYNQPHPDAPPSAERRERNELVSELITRHTLSNESTSFDRAYGWATPLMPRNRNGKYLEPTFTRLEEIADRVDMRLLMKNGAHGYVHNDSGAVRTAVLRDGTILDVGPRADHIHTVAVPALRTVIWAAAATHCAFEPEYNEFGKLICLTAGAILHLASNGIDEFKSVDGTTELLF